VKERPRAAPVPWLLRVCDGLNLPAMVAALLLAAAPVRGAEPRDCLAWIARAEAVLARTDNYTATFHKREMVGGTLRPEETVFFKFKKPFMAYMKWIKPPNRGTEVIYVEGWNGNRLRAHQGGILNILNFNLDPRGTLAMRQNRHPVTDAGLDHLLGIVGGDVRKAVRAGEFQFTDHGEDAVYGRRSRRLEGSFTADRSRGYYCSRAILQMDLALSIPLEVQIYDWDGRLVEDYGYEGLKLDAGLTAADFDPKNPAYAF
jgi:hypothetical protein